MRIGILTYHSVPNFGAQLQTLSTVNKLKSMGHDPLVLDWYPEHLRKVYDGRVPKMQIEEHDRFTRSLPCTGPCGTIDDLVCEIKKYSIEGIIVGSDALFKYIPFVNRIKTVLRHGLIPQSETMKDNPFFGHFLSSIPSIKSAVLSVSSQNCRYKNMSFVERMKMRRGLSHFSYISVRDEWTKGMVDYVTCSSSTIVSPDPVFSFNQNCKDVIPERNSILKKFDLPEDYVLFSFGQHYVDKNYLNSMVREVRKRGYHTVSLPMPEGMLNIETDSCVELPLNPLDWYALIKYSSGYIGERMHPIVVCLHNSVPFYCFDEYGGSNPESSKTFLIINKAGFIQNLFSYNQKEHLPDSCLVIDSLLQFDKEKCQSFSSEYQKKYEQTMSEIICTLSL